MRRRGVNTRRTGPYRAPTAYRGAFAGPYNAASRLSIPTGQSYHAMHPDVVDMGSSWNGGRYWMAFTPYNGDGNTEVPSVAVSSSLASGGTWSVPAGFTNPITPDPAGVTVHMADTDLVYDDVNDHMWVLYVTTDNQATYSDLRGKYTTGDGTWSSEVVVLDGTGEHYANPSVIRTASGWRMFYNKGSEGLFYRDSTTSPGAGYGTEVSAPLSLDYGTVQARWFQNLNVVKDTDGAVIAVISDSNPSTVNGTLYFARSEDGGDTWARTGPEVLGFGPSGNWDAEGIYRASLVTTADGVVVLDGSSLHLFYSAYRDGAATWGTGYTQIPVQCIRF